MVFRIVALDLDGTVLDSGGLIRPRTKAAVAAALERGLEIILVTGRHHVATRPFHYELGLASPAICCNGTFVYDFSAARVLVGDPMDKELARRVLEQCRRYGVDCLVYVDNSMTFEAGNALATRFCAWAAGLEARIRPDIHRVESFERAIDDATRVWKFVVFHEDPAVLAAWQAEAGLGGALSIESSWTNRLDVVRAGNTKGRRLLEWAATRGVDPADIVAFGDNGNDLSMIASVGFGVAMGNGEPALKAVAKWVTGTNNSDGIAETMERFVF